MKRILFLSLILAIYVNTVHALEFEFDKNMIKSGVSSAKGILLHDNTTRPAARSEDADIFGAVGNWKTNNMIRDVEAVAGGEAPVYSLDGKNKTDTKMFCVGNTKIAEVSFSNVSASAIIMAITIDGGQNVNIKGISGLCADGFTVCDAETNKAFCTESLGRIEEGSKLNHLCNSMPNAKCRNWQINVSKTKQLMFDTASGSCSVIINAGAPEYETLTKIISASFSRGGLPIGNIETIGSKSVLYSINSDNCTMGGSGIGSGYTDLEALMSLYDSSATTMPDSSGILAGAVSDNESIYNLIQSGNNIDYGGGTIGSPTFEKCEINNIVTSKINSEEKTSTFSGTYNLCTDLYISGRVVRKDDTVHIEFRGGGLGDQLKNCYGHSGADVAVTNEGWFRAYSFVAPGNIKEIYVDYDVSGCGNGSGSFSLSGGAVQSGTVCIGAGAKYPQIKWKYKMIYAEELLEPDVTLTDTCISMKDRQDCAVKEESICDNNKANCIVTVKNAVKTGAGVNNFCYEFPLGVYTVTACAKGDAIIATSPVGSKSFAVENNEGWFNIQREYKCIPKPSGLENHENFFSDIVEEIGGEAGNINIKRPCVTQYCVVDRVYIKNDIYTDGSTNDTIGNGKSEQRFVKQCVMEGTDMANPKFSCPLQSGETILSGCSCDNDDQLITNLQEVMSGLAILDEVKKMLNCGEEDK